MQQLDLIGDQPQRANRMPVEPIIREAQVEDNYRWTLRRAWGAGPCILWCGLNPSTADARRDDPTMRREIGFSYRWGFGSLVKVNIYPFVTPNQAALRTWRASWRREDWQKSTLNWEIEKSAFNAWLHNMDVVRAAVADAKVCVAAWGNGVDSDDLAEFLGEATIGIDTSEHDGFGVMRFPVEWKCIGRTASGAPTHPLARGAHRVPDDAKLTDWRM